MLHPQAHYDALAAALQRHLDGAGDGAGDGDGAPTGLHATLPALLLHAATAQPQAAHAVALEYGAADRAGTLSYTPRFPAQRLTYAQLLTRALQLARHLRRAYALGAAPSGSPGGSGSGSAATPIVPLLCPTDGKCAELIVAQYAVHLAGAAFAPMDPTFPPDVTRSKVRRCFRPSSPGSGGGGGGGGEQRGEEAQQQRDMQAREGEGEGEGEGGARLILALGTTPERLAQLRDAGALCGATVVRLGPEQEAGCDQRWRTPCDGDDAAAVGGGTGIGAQTSLAALLAAYGLLPACAARASPRVATLHGDAPAYVMFTSGSTGEPKGVVCTHAQACAAVVALVARYCFGPGQRVLGTISAAWDISCCDTYATLSSGGTLLLSATPSVLDTYGEDLAALRATSTNVPPALLSSVARQDTLRGLDVIISGGDRVLPSAFRRWTGLGGPRVFNGYGLTETGIGNLCFDGRATPLAASAADVPLGQPYGANEVSILAPGTFDAVPDGDEGELVLGGPQLAAGYLHDAPRTAARFVRHPATRARLFRTGDLGRRDARTHHIHLAGRSDDVIKLDGYRIGPEEVQAPLRHLLAQQPDAADADATDDAFCCACKVDTTPPPQDKEQQGEQGQDAKEHDTHKLALAFVPPRPASGSPSSSSYSPAPASGASTEERGAALLFPAAEAAEHVREWEHRLRAKAHDAVAYYARPAYYIPIRAVPRNSNSKPDRRVVQAAAQLAVHRLLLHPGSAHVE